MRIGTIAESPLEWLALAAGRIPTPLVDTHLAFAWARTLMVATRLGVFEALTPGPGDATAVAASCGTAPEPTHRLLDALTGMGYLVPSGDRDYALSRSSRRWLSRASPDEVVDKVLFSFDEWRFVEHYERFVSTGEALGMHDRLAGPDVVDGADRPAADRPGSDRPGSDRPGAVTEAGAGGWERYQRGLHALSKVSAAEVGRRTPVPRGATVLLDIGGAHGRFAAALLRRHPALRATVLDLPDAVSASAPLLSAHGLGDRLRHQRGDVFETDLGDGVWDVVFVSQLTHHLTDAANRDLASRITRALRPGGVYVIQDLVRPATPREARRARLGALLDLYFAATSGAGTVTLGTLRAWQADAGLLPRRPVWMRTLPGMVQQVGVRPT
ncbi:MAG: methyltransferase domain-containing protein [Trueperaceae bacterium]|nr:methyltransferase domain-containing protein [Trueperaceae bacterium]